MSRILLLGLLLVGVAIFAGTRPTSDPQVVHAASQSFAPTGAMQTFDVPAGVTQVTIEVRGANGGAGGAGAAGCVAPVGGLGGRISATFTLAPGTTQLFVFVGSNGAAPGAAGNAAGGFNGGGTGGNNLETSATGPQFRGGGGGGATDVRTNAGLLTSRLITAGGGGGGGGCSGPAPPVPSDNNGGAGGSAGLDVVPGCVTGGNGLPLVPPPTPGLGGVCGGGGGAGGAGNLAGGNGSAGQGGAGGNDGGNASCGCGGQGGGGGGGQTGGGGGGGTQNDGVGGGGGGGGAGSNAIAAGGVPAAGNTLLTSGAIITWAVTPTGTKTFTPPNVALNQNSLMTITLPNTNAFPLTPINFVDPFPAGMTITGVFTNTCGGTVTAPIGGTSVTLTNGSIPPGGCAISMNVASSIGGARVNTVPAIPIIGAASIPSFSGTLNVAIPSTATPIPPTVTPTVVLFVPPPVIPQVFQHIPQGIFNGSRNNTPTPVVRAAVAPIVAAPAGPVTFDRQAPAMRGCSGR